MKKPSRVATNIAANFVGRGWTALLTLCVVPLYIEFLGVEAYGLVGFHATLLSVLPAFDLGLSTTITRELANRSTNADEPAGMHDLLRTLEVIYWLLAAVIGFIFFTLAPWLAEHWIKTTNLPLDTVCFVIRAIAVTMAFQFPFALYSGGLMGLQAQVALNSISVAMVTVRSMGAVFILWWVSSSIEIFFFWQLLASLLQTFLIGKVLWSRLPASPKAACFRKEMLVPVWRFAAGMTGVSTVGLVLTHADKILLSKMLPLELFGYYSFAALVGSYINSIVGPFYSALFPKFAQLVYSNNKEDLVKLYHCGCQLVAICIMPLSLLLIFFSKNILLVWTGKELLSENTHMVLSLLVAGTLINGILNLPFALQLSYGWTSMVFRLNIVLMCFFLPGLYVMTSLYGMLGPPTLWIILNCCYLIVLVQLMHRRILAAEKAKWYLQDVFAPFMAGLVVVLIAKFSWGWQTSASQVGWSLAVVFLLCSFVTACCTPVGYAWLRKQARYTFLGEK